MIESEWQKRMLADRRHAKRMEEIRARRPESCHNCAFFIDRRFCGNTKNASLAWADSHPTLSLMMVTATQGCDLFEQRLPTNVREPDPEAIEASDAYYRAWVLKDRAS